MDILENQIVKEVMAKFAKPLMKQLIKISKDEWEKFKIDFDIVFTKYLTKSYDKYCKIKTILYKTEPQYIYDFFESPSLLKKPKVLVNTETIDTILDISNFIIIQGTGGIGKSTLLKHLFINELENKDLIPVFIELKDINLIENDYTILDIIFDKLTNLGSSLKKEYIEYALNSGCFLFLLDGYDEIVSSKKDSFFRKLDEFCDKYTENYFIMSSRPYSEFVEFQRFTVLKALPLTKKQAVSLVNRINYENGIKERFIAELETNLYESHTSFASNPLLLNIMLLTFDNYADIPEKLHLFYSNAFETLYSKHDATKAGYKREMLSTLSYDSFKKVFAYFCFMTYIKGLTEFTYEELQETLKRIKIPRIEFDIDNYIFDLVNSLCLIYKEGFSYTFAHRSFQEYFTAVFLRELSDINLQKYAIQMIKREPERASQDNVFEMLYDMIEEKFEKNILLPILSDYEDSIPADEDKYWFYFTEVVHNIRFDRDENNELRLWLRRENTEDFDNSLIVFIRAFTQKYIVRSREKEERNQTYSEKLFMYLTENKNYVLDVSLDTISIINDANVREIIKKTWIGELVQCMTDLKQHLTQKLEENEDALDNMLEFEDTV